MAALHHIFFVYVVSVFHSAPLFLSPRGKIKKKRNIEHEHEKKGSVSSQPPTTHSRHPNHTLQTNKKKSKTYRNASGNEDTKGQTKTPSQGHGEPGVVVGENHLGNGARTEGNQDGGSQELGESLAELFSVKVVG